ncbi:MAG: preprotein translocase subunit SecA [Deferribacteraceae bacterium]|jgi:preprotein translocase subunit SecA|nr:preprotein translocase subunit SecA [Deferribacteraceae bacterium]
MLKFILNRMFGSWQEKYIKKLKPIIAVVNALEDRFSVLPDSELRSVTENLKSRLADGASLDDILPDAFAIVRETSKRILKMCHYDVQLMGGCVLHRGQISEMKTGEGKTLVATLALYLNALEGKGAHLVTVNDYLARRDAVWMGPIYLKLGLSVGIIQNDRSEKVVWTDETAGKAGTAEITRQEAYACDITYGTNNEFGFDYLRDNMKYEQGSFVQRDLNFAIVDEVDSILIDEARTPLIISGPTEESTDKYYLINNVVKHLRRDVHYTVDEKHRTSALNDDGINYVEKELKVGNIFDVANVNTLHFVNNALKAHAIFKPDVDYVVQNNQVVIVDEFTGRLMPGRRFSDGLHQALEAKEGVQIQNENQTLASITFQNYFRMYKKLAGMTGTALTEAEELRQIYKLTVISIPTHQKMIRNDQPDMIYRTSEEKYEAIAKEIARLYHKGQPTLVGTVSIEKSELLSKRLHKLKIPHDVLNAKNHEREAAIVENAGRRKTVTIATNMAGRGTDIKLGEGVAGLDGLFILGTERHESRRIDNQLRGRSGRQGDPGESRFYLSLEDDLLRIFGAERISGLMNRMGMQKGEPIEHNLISRAIEGAQKKVEAMHFEIRKHLLEYDNVANQQRQVIYGLRRNIISGGDINGLLAEFSETIADNLYAEHIHINKDNAFFSEAVEKIYGDPPDLSKTRHEHFDTYKSAVLELYARRIVERRNILGEHFESLARFLFINIIDARWKEHLLQMDYLRDSVGLRGYGQKDPLIEYKKESFTLFTNMYSGIQFEAVGLMMHIQLQNQTPVNVKRQDQRQLREERRDIFKEGGEQQKTEPVRRNHPKVGRNEPCPCGSGKKYKNCHGAA